MPFVHLEGRLLHLPYTRPLQLGETEANALRLCDGERTASDVVGLLASAQPALTSEEGYRLLRSLEARGLLTWTLEVPLQLEPDRVLKLRLERIGDLPLRARALDTLGKLEAARGAVTAAAGDPDRLNLALGRLETVFSEVTGLRQPASAARRMRHARWSMRIAGGTSTWRSAGRSSRRSGPHYRYC